jgi:uncharacterized membrane protein
VILLHDEKRIKKNGPAFFGQKIPVDLILVVVWLAAGIMSIYLPFLNATPVRFILVLPVILFIPGYCLISALFPRESDIDLMQRIALSFGLSIAIVPLIGFGLNFTPWGIRLDPIVISLTLFTLVMVLIAYYTRARLPLNEQFRMPFAEIADSIQKEIFSGGKSTVNRVLSATLICVIIIAIITTIYVFTVPKEGERYTEFFVLGENRTVVNYPDEINTSQNYPIYVGVGNHEYRNSNYIIETWIMRTEFNNMTNTTRILAMDPQDRLLLSLSHNETKLIPYNLSVSKTGYNRVELLLFKEVVPGFEVTGSDRINASYRNLHLWVTVQDGLNLENRNYILL